MSALTWACTGDTVLILLSISLELFKSAPATGPTYTEVPKQPEHPLKHGEHRGKTLEASRQQHSGLLDEHSVSQAILATLGVTKSNVPKRHVRSTSLERM